ncbi:hypothetical protein PBI_PAEDORE_78 [Streptomyces phage Paedore]|uniref:Uncharacterized protein n=1 Tax=Streptomyces phage Paedore TaxID=2108134 RepID=A0A2P1JTU5_9CAUD|nr:hypothetical protein KGG91_gp78 [Streptomyces phage Paedore]AVO22561.1 hypothetical protein PBI_PAEDORE_78 [Streptomyces phage Paedore]
MELAGYSIAPEYSVEQLAELLADLEHHERRRVLELADQIAASHYE